VPATRKRSLPTATSTIELSDPAKAWLIQHGYDEQMGSTPDGAR